MDLSRAQRPALCLAALLGLLAGCERAPEPGPEPAVIPAEPLQMKPTPTPDSTSLGADTLSAEIRRIKDLIADDRISEADRRLIALKRNRAAFPAERQAEIDRLDALCSAMQ